ncbi:hypothetical protein pb186bvf_018577 [Paramecium bursaria]
MLNEFQEIIYDIESDDSIEILKEFPLPRKTIEIRNQQIKQSDVKVLSDQDIKLIQKQKLIEQEQQIQQQIQETQDKNQQIDQQQDQNQIETQQDVVADKPEPNPGSFFMIYGRKKFGTLQRMTQRVSEEEFELFQPKQNKQQLEQDDDVIFEKTANNNQTNEQDPRTKAKIKNEKFQKLLQTHMAGQSEFIDVIMNMDSLDQNIQPQPVNLKPTLKQQGKNQKPKGKRNVQFGQNHEADVQLPTNIIVKNYSATPQSLLAPVQLMPQQEQENSFTQNQQPLPKQMTYQLQQQQYQQNQKQLQQQQQIDSINQEQEKLQQHQAFLQQQQQEQQKPKLFQPPYVNRHMMKPLPHISQLPSQENQQKMTENRYKNNSYICQVRRETTPPRFRDLVTQQFQSTYQQQAEKPFIPDRKQPLFSEQERIRQQNMDEHIKKLNEKEFLKAKKMAPPKNVYQEPEKPKKIENDNPIKSYQAERFKQEQLKTINEPPQIKQKADLHSQRPADYKEVESLKTVKDALDNMVHIKDYIQQKQLDWTMKEFVEIHQYLMVCEPSDELSDKMRMLLTQLDKIINVDMVLIDSQEAREEEQEKSQQYVLPSNKVGKLQMKKFIYQAEQ